MAVKTLDVIHSLERSGIRLSIKGEKIIAAGPLDDQARQLIRENRDDLFAALRFTTEADQAVNAMLRRCSDLIPEEHHVESWIDFDRIGREIDRTRQRHDMQGLRDVIKRYENAAVQEITTRA